MKGTSETTLEPKENASVFSKNKLTQVIIPPTITKIYSSAFSSNNLTSISIPNSVTYIGSHAFHDND